MSLHEQAVELIEQLVLMGDGALVGVGVAYVAYRSIRKFLAASSVLRKIREAPSVHPSDLRALLSDGGDACRSSNFRGGKLVVVRGSVDVKFGADNGGSVVVSESGERGVILQRTEIGVYNESIGSHMLSRSCKGPVSSSTRTVPFILVEAGKWPQSDYLVVNMEGSTHPVPLTTVYDRLQHISSINSTYFQAPGREIPVGMLHAEKILPLGNDITAVGICNLKDEILEIKSCKDLPYFLSRLTKDEIVDNLTFKTKFLMWSSIVFGSLAIGILGYSIARNWIRWKHPQQNNAWRHPQQRPHQQNNAWRHPQQRPHQQNNDYAWTNETYADESDMYDDVADMSAAMAEAERSAAMSERSAGVSERFADVADTSADVAADDESDDIPDGEQCVVCLASRRRSAFVPCGHFVCCQQCASTLERERSPKCPVCREPITSSVRIFDS